MWRVLGYTPLRIPATPYNLYLTYDTGVYEVFEKDPVKYEQYQSAIALALTHLSGDHLSSDLCSGPDALPRSSDGEAALLSPPSPPPP